LTRDSLFGDPVLWSGRPKEISTPPIYRSGAVVCAITSAITTAWAIVVSTALRVSPGQLVIFAAWMATLAVALFFGPRWWRSELEFVLTDRHIVMRRGRLRRSIDRRDISFARIHWNPKRPGIGDLELVRAVPTGALRRRLAIALPGLVAPDRVWAIMRGVTPSAPAGDGHRLLAQRLDEGERVLWSAHPANGWRKWVPTGARPLGTIAGGLCMALCGALILDRAIHILRFVVAAGLRPRSFTFIAIAASLSLTIGLLISAAMALVYVALVRPARLDAETRYLITDRRVLIQRGDEELHLDRSRIVDVIEAPLEGGLRDLFLVLDGPRSRAVAAGGAFGEAPGQGLQPVLHRVADADAAHAILRGPDAPAFPRAA
jgi:hypothetical protein